MDELPQEMWLAEFFALLFLASIATWIGLASRWRRGRAILEYEPRSPVPWGVPIALLSALFVAASFYISVTEGPAQEAELNPSEVFQHLLGFIFFQTVLTGGVLFFVAVLYRARPHDYGLPSSAKELMRDVRIGIVAWLASIAPVQGLQILLLYLFGLQEEPSNHPLVKMVTSGEPNVSLLVLATAAAVVVAPLSEEILFRLLLQGWLEKWEDMRLGWRTEEQNDEARMTNDETAATNIPSFVIRHSSLDDATPSVKPLRGLAGLPYGVAPILISSLLFAVAHYGYGPDPVAIFFLALILGYVYQRTHRIVPCIVTHALFNSLAMLVLWRLVFHNAK
jgi:membrane protease YdiL (CAAX protease family)